MSTPNPINDLAKMAKQVRLESDINKYAKHIDDEREKNHEAPAGTLGLPPLLDKRRLHYGIPNEAFNRQAAFDRILIHQIPETEGETYEGTGIIKPDTWAAAHNAAFPRGVIVSAGARALDVMRSNAIDLGHIITFLRMAPFRVQYCKIAGHEFSLIVQNVGDIIDSEDTMTAMREKRIELAWDSEAGKHLYLDSKTGEKWDPQTPWVGGGY